MHCGKCHTVCFRVGLEGVAVCGGGGGGQITGEEGRHVQRRTPNTFLLRFSSQNTLTHANGEDFVWGGGGLCLTLVVGCIHRLICASAGMPWFHFTHAAWGMNSRFMCVIKKKAQQWGIQKCQRKNVYPPSLRTFSSPTHAGVDI